MAFLALMSSSSVTRPYQKFDRVGNLRGRPRNSNAFAAEPNAPGVPTTQPRATQPAGQPGRQSGLVPSIRRHTSQWEGVSLDDDDDIDDDDDNDDVDDNVDDDVDDDVDKLSQPTGPPRRTVNNLNAARGASVSNQRTIIKNMTNLDYISRTLLLSRKQPDLLLVSRGSGENINELAAHEPNGISSYQLDRKSPSLVSHVLPEPNVIADAFDTLRVQSQRIANVGAIQNQQNGLAAIQALGQQMDQRFQQTNQRINDLQQQMNQMNQQMNQRFNTLEHRQYNFEIAGVNTRLFFAHGANVLQRPVDIRNGGDIPGFPLTHTQLYAIDDATAEPFFHTSQSYGQTTNMAPTAVEKMSNNESNDMELLVNNLASVALGEPAEGNTNMDVVVVPVANGDDDADDEVRIEAFVEVPD
ncbi:hypothetical protein B0T24DRAFT_723945 [Lasiosphaeria ovina]|uniref:Pyrroloquinoline quinone-dependent pyranose dehydrogenase beta-propeller domain-containing protein n=1 Tax=Lasiosphaeria ovina TaxID=92902 RepID=A0AAE0JV62_9PEZI|nr:hypothetical protein B0T24DRAFT_723945 [Lasiosphaeria ovina]